MTIKPGLELAAFSKTIRAQDDLFRHVNGEWMATTEIPADKSMYGSFHALADASEEAVKQAVLAAPSVSYSTGPSGVALAKMFERWGIAGQVQDKIVTPPPGTPVGSLVAKGEVALGFQQLSELIHVEGIDIVGPLPSAIAIDTVFSGAVREGSDRTADVRALLDFLASPATADAKRRQGMQPL